MYRVPPYGSMQQTSSYRGNQLSSPSVGRVNDLYQSHRRQWGDERLTRERDRSPIRGATGNAAPQISSDPFKINGFLTSARSSQEIFAIIENNINHFNEVNTATAFNKLAHAFERERRTIDRCTDYEKKTVANLQAKASNFLHQAYYLIGNQRLKYEHVPQPFKARELANLSWAFAKLGIRDFDFSLIAWFSAYNIDGFNSQDFANLAWAFAKLEIKDGTLFQEIARASKKKIDDFKSQELANLAWAFATLGIKDEPFFQEIAKASMKEIGTLSAPKKKLDDFNSQNFANLAWAFATLEIKDEALFKEIAGVLIKEIGTLSAPKKKLDDFNSQNFANLAWAFATLGIKDDTLFKEIAGVSMKEIGTLSAPKKKLDGFEPQGLANLAWSFAIFGIKDEALFKEIAGASMKEIGTHLSPKKRLEDIKSQEVANLAWAFAKLGIKDEALFKEIARVLMKEIGTLSAPKKKLDDIESQEVANLAWAFAVIDLVLENKEFIEALLNKVQEKGYLSFKSEEIKQLNQTHLFLTKVKNFTVPWNNDLLTKINQRALLEAKEHIHTSNLQKDVANELEKWSFKFTQEYIDPQTGYPIDIAFVEQKVAIEVDGPSHFIGRSREYNQITKFKEMLLKACGWKVIHVPYFVWEKLQNGQKVDFFRGFLN